MSYDMRVCVKVEGCDKYAVVGYPEFDDPTYNLREMFVECMGWRFKQGDHYRAVIAAERIDRGIRELTARPDHYDKLNPPNGWGSRESALKAIESARKCIYECAEEYPIGCLYFRW